MIADISRLTLTQARRLRGFSQPQMARMLGVSVPTYSRYERQPDKIPIKNVFKLCNFLSFTNGEIDFLDSSSKETDFHD